MYIFQPKKTASSLYKSCSVKPERLIVSDGVFQKQSYLRKRADEFRQMSTDLNSSLNRQLIELDGILHETFTLPAQNQSDIKCKIIAIPGNPGYGLFYEDYLTHLQQKLGPDSTQAVSISLLHHSPAYSNMSKQRGFKPAIVEDQIRHVQRQIELQIGLQDNKKQYGSSENCQIIVAAHSIGGYFALEALARIAASNNDIEQTEMNNDSKHQTLQLDIQQLQKRFNIKVLLLAPYLQTDYSQKEQNIIRIATVILPLVVDVQRTERVVPILLRLVTPTLFFNSITLARDELTLLLEPYTIQKLRAFSSIICGVIAGPSDGWCFADVQDKIEEALGYQVLGRRGEAVPGWQGEVPELRHSFPIISEQSKLCAEYTLMSLQHGK